jgi:hypothetical protein
MDLIVTAVTSKRKTFAGFASIVKDMKIDIVDGKCEQLRVHVNIELRK